MPNFARERIRENMETYARGEDATYLDLGNCGMTGNHSRFAAQF